MERSPKSKARSLSDGGGTPGSKLSPSPLILEASRRTSKDDSALVDSPVPVTPRRPDFTGPLRGLSLQMPQRDLSPAQHSPPAKPTPLSPKLDHSQIYASPTSILPRRSRGLDFSRAATSLHHSTLAEQSSPDSSPTIGGGGRAMNIPCRRSGDYGVADSTTSLWSVMGSQERMHMSSSLGSTQQHPLVSDSSSSSDLDDDMMDEDEEMVYVTTPQVNKMIGEPGANGFPAGSPAVNSLLSFQQRQRPRKQLKRKNRGPTGIIPVGGPLPNLLSKSPPSGMMGKDGSHARRESISWAANQLHISGNESDENMTSPQMDGIDAHQLTPGRGGAIRRVVHRRQNLFPKTKGFARIRAALAEEGAPIESEVRREAEVVRQVRESDLGMDSLESRVPGPISVATTAQSSPNLPNTDSIDEPCDDMLVDPNPVSTNPLSSSFKAQAIRNSKGKNFWETFSGASSIHTTPPPPSALPRGSSSNMGTDDMNMDSPFIPPPPSSTSAIFPMTSSSSGGETPQPTAGGPQANGPPSAAEITRRINNKRRRDDDAFDPVSFKRRAVSPGMSVHNSPVMQSPLQRDMSWGSRPGSNGGDRAGGSGAPSESGSQGPGQSQPGNGSQGQGTRPNGSKGRVGFQGMVDTHDGITRLSIE